MVKLLFSLSTSQIRSALAILMLSITNIMATIIRLIRIFMQYVSRLISSPVVSVSCTICFAPSQLINRIQP